MPAAAAAKADKPADNEKRKQHSENLEENEEDRDPKEGKKWKNTGERVRKKEWLVPRDCWPDPLRLLGGPEDQKDNNCNNNSNEEKITFVNYVFNPYLYKLTLNQTVKATFVRHTGRTNDCILSLSPIYLSNYRLIITGDYRPLSIQFFCKASLPGYLESILYSFNFHSSLFPAHLFFTPPVLKNSTNNSSFCLLYTSPSPRD